MKDIDNILQEKREEVVRLRRLVKQAEEDLRILGRAYELMGGTIEKIIKKTLPFATNLAQESISNADAVEIILRDYGRPLHLNDIYKEIKNRYGKNTTKQSVVATIIRYMKQGKRFKRTDPNVFALLKWNGDKHEPDMNSVKHHEESISRE